MKNYIKEQAELPPSSVNINGLLPLMMFPMVDRNSPLNKLTNNKSVVNEYYKKLNVNVSSFKSSSELLLE